MNSSILLVIYVLLPENDMRNTKFSVAPGTTTTPSSGEILELTSNAAIDSMDWS